MFVIGISSYSGGGKTTLTNALVERNPDNSVGIFLDDYGDYLTCPPIETWKDGVHLDEWHCSRLADDLMRLKLGKSIIHPITNLKIEPKPYIFLIPDLAKNILKPDNILI